MRACPGRLDSPHHRRPDLNGIALLKGNDSRPPFLVTTRCPKTFRLSTGHALSEAPHRLILGPGTWERIGGCHRCFRYLRAVRRVRAEAILCALAGDAVVQLIKSLGADQPCTQLVFRDTLARAQREAGK